MKIALFIYHPPVPNSITHIIQLEFPSRETHSSILNLKGIKAQKGYMPCSGLHMMVLGFKPSSPESKAGTFYHAL